MSAANPIRFWSEGRLPWSVGFLCAQPCHRPRGTALTSCSRAGFDSATIRSDMTQLYFWVSCRLLACMKFGRMRSDLEQVAHRSIRWLLNRQRRVTSSSDGGNAAAVSHAKVGLALAIPGIEARPSPSPSRSSMQIEHGGLRRCFVLSRISSSCRHAWCPLWFATCLAPHYGRFAGTPDKPGMLCRPGWSSSEAVALVATFGRWRARWTGSHMQVVESKASGAPTWAGDGSCPEYLQRSSLEEHALDVLDRISTQGQAPRPAWAKRGYVFIEAFVVGLWSHTCPHLLLFCRQPLRRRWRCWTPSTCTSSLSATYGNGRVVEECWHMCGNRLIPPMLARLATVEFNSTRLQWFIPLCFSLLV